MPDSHHEEIAKMDWDTFEERLRATTRRVTRGPSDEKALREYFGDEEYEALQRLAEHARLVRSRAPALGNVVLLHGIMGSNLVTTESDGDQDLVWVNLFRLALGQLERLKLAPDGSSDNDHNFKVDVGALDKRTYSRAILWLRARWNIQPFAYDWRKDIDTASNDLASFIRGKFGDQPVHLVAHSMGGLVSRNFIRLHRELWEKISDAGGSRGGRLIMLGTPNFGSFAIPQVMTGVETLVRWLSRIDLDHSLSEILEIINTFVGSYQMLPAPNRIPASTQPIYRRETWGKFPVSETHLSRAFQFHYDLEKEQTVDPERMIYIAGCGRETISGLKILSQGEFDYTVTYNGDGRVPHELGLLKDVPTYYVDESHGDLPRNEKVLAAVDELLERGRTFVLPDRPIVVRAIYADGAPWRRSIAEQQIGIELEDIAKRARQRQARSDEVRLAEEAITRAMMGPCKVIKKLPQPEKKKERRKQAERLPLCIEVVHGDITQVKSPVAVVGHYKGVVPVSAEGAIDEAIGYWISHAGKFGMIGADLGELFFIPITRNQIAAKAVLLAGMGESGRFTRDDLRYLMMNVAYAISALGLDRFATVLIGSGEGNLTKERAIRGMLDGICDALRRLPGRDLLKQITLVEYLDEHYENIRQILKKLKDEKSIADLDLDLASRKLPPAKRKRGPERRPPDLPAESLPGTRITIERDGDTFLFSALHETAVIPVRRVEVQSFFASEASERLMLTRTREEQEKYGRLLHTYLIPEDFHRLVDTVDSLTLILDRSTASFPWEMVCFKSLRGMAVFGTDLKLTRQFRTMLSSAPGLAPPLNRSLKILVIADPAPEPELQLPGARQEGREVVRVLNQFKQSGNLEIEIADRIGAIECDPVEILALILNEEFDIVHFAGHGIFNEKDPSHSGWIFGKNCILSAREIFRARRVPRLVFANACFSAVVREGKATAAEDSKQQLAGLAEAFFERGIENYIGTGWPVEDSPAVKFATVFYQEALAGETLGDSLSTARKEILDNGPTWGAYQHYGQVNARLIARE